MKLKLPVLDLWLVSGRRLRAGYAHRYKVGYEEGWSAASHEATRPERVRNGAQGTGVPQHASS